MNHCEEGVHNCEERGAQLGGAPAERELRGGEQRDDVRGEGYKHLHEEGYKHLRTRDAQRVRGRVERALPRRVDGVLQDDGDAAVQHAAERRRREGRAVPRRPGVGHDDAGRRVGRAAVEAVQLLAQAERVVAQLRNSEHCRSPEEMDSAEERARMQWMGRLTGAGDAFFTWSVRPSAPLK